jgi:hypothetical protein
MTLLNRGVAGGSRGFIIVDGEALSYEMVLDLGRDSHQLEDRGTAFKFGNRLWNCMSVVLRAISANFYGVDGTCIAVVCSDKASSS